MFTENSGILKAVLSFLFFPLLFQDAFVQFAWGAGDPFWSMAGKRTFLLLPTLAFILGCWASIACLLSVVMRPNRREFLTDLLITWWDLGKSIIMYWGGLLKFGFIFAVAVVEFAKVTVMAAWSLVQEVIFTPFRMVKSLSQNVLSSPVPWVAVFMTIFWCFVEAVIFTYVMTPLVLDVFSNITGETLHINYVRIPLFVFLLFIVLGSYAVLSNFVDAVKQKSVRSIVSIAAIEAVVLMVEVLFLYREFVDALVPWFAQYSSDFSLGVPGILGISTFVWFGIRSLSWFLFAAHGTPTILYLIQGRGMVVFSQPDGIKTRLAGVSSEFVDRLKTELAWMQTQAEGLLASLMLPPLQVIAAGLNFCTLLLSGNHLFDLPFKSMASVTDTKSLRSTGSVGRKPAPVEQPEPRREYENIDA